MDVNRAHNINTHEVDSQRGALDTIGVSETLAEYAAAHLRAEMARREISSIKLAEMLGVSDMWVSRRMRGKTRITMEDLERLAEALGVPMASFLPAGERVA